MKQSINNQLQTISEKQFRFAFLALLFSCLFNLNIMAQSSRFYPEPTDYYTISLKGKNVTIKNPKAEANVFLSSPTGGEDQLFRIIEQKENGRSTNFYLIEPRAKKGLYLTVDYSRIKEGTNIKLNPRKTKNQLWTFKNGAIETALSLNKFIGTQGSDNLVIVDRGPSFNFTKVGNEQATTSNPPVSVADYFKTQNLSTTKKCPLQRGIFL